MTIPPSARMFPIVGTSLVLLFQSLEVRAGDWLIDPSPYRATVTQDRDAVVLANGLVRREIKLAPNAACVSFENLTTGMELSRSVRPEAELEIDGTKFAIGGLAGQPVHNYLDRRWLTNMPAIPGSYVFDHAEIGATQERFPWKKRTEWLPQDVPWPPPGKSVTLHFRPPAAPPTTAACQSACGRSDTVSRN